MTAVLDRRLSSPSLTVWSAVLAAIFSLDRRRVLPPPPSPPPAFLSLVFGGKTTGGPWPLTQYRSNSLFGDRRHTTGCPALADSAQPSVTEGWTTLCPLDRDSAAARPSDLRPTAGQASNCLLTREGALKLTDYGPLHAALDRGEPRLRRFAAVAPEASDRGP